MFTVKTDVIFFVLLFSLLNKKKFFKRVKKAHTWEVPQRDSDEQKAIEEEDDEFMRKKLAETLLNGNESKLLSLDLTLTN